MSFRRGTPNRQTPYALVASRRSAADDTLCYEGGTAPVMPMPNARRYASWHARASVAARRQAVRIQRRSASASSETARRRAA